MTLDDDLARTILGDVSAARRLAAFEPAIVCATADAHGVLPLVADVLETEGEPASPLRIAVEGQVRQQIAIDMAREVELRALLEALDADAVPAVLMKGAQLAYSVYRKPHFRPRIDTDVVIARSDRQRAGTILVRLGYEKLPHVDGDLVTQQAIFEKRRDGARVHVVDLHWRVANPHVFADVLSFDELRSSSVPMPRLGPSARGLALPHALLLACVHRIAHHADADRLIWLYDIHLLASAASPADWMAFVELARQRKVAAVCARSIERALTAFGEERLAAAREPLGVLSTTEGEPTSRYLQRNRTRAADFLADLAAVESWTGRWRLAYQHLVPSVRYMREVYAPADRSPLPLLYVRRLVSGTRKWLVRN